MTCTVVVNRGDGSAPPGPCGHPQSDHVTTTEAFTMIEADTYCRACFAERDVMLSDTQHDYVGTTSLSDR